MTKMFTYNGQKMITWNPQTGCNYACSYCWARRLAGGKLKKAYPNGFIPEFHENRVNRRFKPGEFVFISSMGDISFSENLFPEIMGTVEDNPDTRFLLCTKNPSIYIAVDFPDNVYTGATIESNRDYHMSKAPHPRQRALDMMMNHNQHKFISIEPIMDFDLDIFATWLEGIEPEIVEVGADNYHNFLPEPAPEKLKTLLKTLREFVPNVIEKQGLERLLKEPVNVGILGDDSCDLCHPKIFMED